MRKSMAALTALSLLVPLLFFGCGGSDGSPGTSAPATGNIAGAVTDAVKGDALSGVTATAKSSDNTVQGTATTDATGAYTLTNIPLGTVTVTFSKTNYTPPGGLVVGVLGGKTITMNATMAEAASGAPSVAITGYNNGLYTTDNFGYGKTTALAASATDPNGDNVTYAWSNTTSPVMGSVTGSGTAGTVTFPTMTVAFATRQDTANRATISGYNFMDNEIGRFGILPILADTRGTVTARVTASDGRGQSSSVSISLNAANILTGARNVAVGTRIYMNRGDDNAANTWTLGAKPAGAAAALDNATLRTPSFLADLVGAYTLTTAGGKSITINAGNWVGIITGGTDTTVAVDPACTGCHNDVNAVNNFTPWLGTAHSKIFTLGINGGAGTSGISCMDCHSVGFDHGTGNNGIDEQIVSTGWVFPATRKAGNWASMLANYPSVARMVNIQCENCHGPNNSGAHGSTGPINSLNVFASDRISFSAEACATCHASGAGHNVYSEWAESPHSNRELALGEGTSTNCGRCHGAQGFTLLVDQLAEGNVGPINNIQFSGYSIDNVFTSSVNATNVEPQTCVACHDPHDATNPNQLRVYDTVPKTLAGFAVKGFGKGAICTTCHSEGRSGGLWHVNAANDNTQTFLHEDAVTGGLDPQTTSPPHISAITDVLIGRNVYFMGSSIPMGSKHLAVEDVCVGCHMRLNPKTHLSHGTPATDLHRFQLEFTEDPTKPETQRANFCANCHGAGGVNGEAIIAAVQSGIDALTVKMGADMLAKLQSFGDNTVQLAFGVQVPGNSITAATFAPNLGTSRPPGTTFSIVSGGTARNVTLANFRLGSDNTVQIFPNSSNMMKAIWNYGIVFAGGGGPKCFHNPSFLLAVLNNTRATNLAP